MSSIAERYYGDRSLWTVVAKANPLIDPAHMKIGTKLVVPAKPAAPTTPAPTTPAPTTPAPTTPAPVGTGSGTATGETIHTVVAGDTLIKLSRRYYGADARWEEIFEANRRVLGDDPANLKVGMKLVIPKR
jgi:nucleoid-associated protein YgaU